MGGITPAHLVLVLVIALLVLGPGKLPETGAALGRAMRDFRHGLDGKDESSPESHVAMTAVPAEATPPQAAIAAGQDDQAGG